MNMTLNFRKRLLMLAHWVASALICAVLCLCVFAPGLMSRFAAGAEASLGRVGSRIAAAVLLALYAALAAAQLCLIFRRRRKEDKGFITVGSDEIGRVRIAVSAVEQMVRQSVKALEGIDEMKVTVEGVDDAIAIGVVATIAAGSRVPILTANMQRAISQFVEDNCGVSVHDVTVTIEALSGQAEPSRRLLSRPKARPAQSPQQPERQGEIRLESAPQTEAEPDAIEPFEADAPAFDPDKPYESEFARDLAAMKAREAAQKTPEE